MEKMFIRWVLLICFALAAGSASALPGTALRFNGTNNSASVGHNAALDAFPMTVTAWFRCTTNTALPQTIVSKYANSSYDGWALVVQSGQLRGFYYRVANASTNKAIDATAGAFVADSLWHHAALTVDTNGGRLFLDGMVIASNIWQGTAGAISNNKPLVFSGLNDGSYPFNGDLDEITLWSRALTGNEVNYLKHRQLRGGEDGLLGDWKFDDGIGAVTAIDSTGHGYTATLNNSPAWVPSGAPLDLNMVATNCVKFAGTSGIVTIPNAPDLNPYPFTATAWFRTTTNASAIQVIAAKYTDISYNGWAMVVQNGQLRAFLYRNGSSINKAIDATATPIVADGGWHHAALVVDATGGKIFLDGNLVISSNWVGTAGATTSTAPITFGALANGYPLYGDVDEVTLWSRAVSATEIAAQKNLPLVGDEANLVGYWKLDEDTGNTTTTDSTGNGHTGTLSGAVSWTGSTAYLGDGTTHLLASLDYANLARTFAITGSATQSAFPQNASVTFSRIYDYGTAPAGDNVSGVLDYALQTSASTPIPLTQSETTFNVSLGAQLASAPRISNAANGWLTTSQILSATPNGVQLDSVDNLHQLITTLSHTENGGALFIDSTNTGAATRLLHFDGNLFCGPLLTLFNNLAATPVVTNLVAGDHLDCSLAVSANAGSIPGTSYRFGNGTPLSVSLSFTGDCTLKNGSISVAGTGNNTIQNISYQLANVTLQTNGASGNLLLNLPVGLTVGITNSSSRLTTNTLPFFALLDASLQPQTNVLTAPNTPLYFSVETLPCWIVTSQFSWRVFDGQLVIPASSIQFVRQFEDDVLTANQALLTDTNAANRISNDGYFRNAQPAANTNFIITADANGFAQVNGSIGLQPPELRPHFPYASTLPGSQIPTSSGVFTLQNNLVTSDSVLGLSGAVPLQYSRDCADTNCSGASAGLATVSLAPPAYQLTFTPDGGLLGYGPVSSPENSSGVALMWGYNSAGIYAQQTSIVGNGVYEMAGNILRGDQTAPANSQRAVALLFTGWGDDSNPSYLERPGTLSYANGLANYAGLNLRAPAQASSYIANVPTGWYPLTAQAKYYVRNGGVSGLHEAASFPPNFKLYGYNFTFATYLLSYLDSENYQSRTDGGITFPPQPAGFTIGFENMKFVCSGGLESAQLPAGTGSKHLNYWNADFTPLSIQFEPMASEQCSTANRTLVLGTELHLPFIPQAMHGTMGFGPDGNISTVANQVVGTDSRFALPASLTLQGSGTNMYPISVASEGYFNNWATSNHPAVGFFNLAGKIRVPFFQDFKAHLQVTPTGTNQTDASIALAGGWPLANNSTAADLGWSVNGSNFFNTDKFDVNCDGWPTTTSLQNYAYGATEQYHARAQRNWKNLAFFDYPISWDPVLRQFQGLNTGTLSLPILDVGSNLKLLTAGKVDFDFNQDLNLGLPHIKQLDFINDSIDGPFNSISNAILQELHNASDASGLTKGFRSLEGALNQDLQGFFSPILDVAFNNLANNLVTNFAKFQTTDPTTVLSQVNSTMAAANAQFQSAVSAINGTVNQANSVLGTINSTFGDVTNTIGVLLQMLQPDADGNRHILRALVENLVKDQSPDLAGIFEGQADALDGIVNDALGDYESDLQGIQDDLSDLNSQISDAHTSISAATGPIVDALNAITNETANIQQFEQLATTDVSNLLATVVTKSGDYFTANPVAAQSAIKSQLENAFLNSALTGDYKTRFQQFLGDDDFILDQLLCVLTDKINRAVRSAVEDYISGGNSDSIYNVMKGIGQMQKTLATAKLRGQPTFKGDTLEMIHLDADLQINLPDTMRYNAYIEIKNLDSQSGALACAQGGDSAAEIILGANKVPLDWPGAQNTGITLTANARWTMDNGTVTGVGGLMELDGKADFEGFSLKQLGATFAVGQSDNYFAGKASVVVFIGPVPVELQAGIFGGHSCSLDPILYVDTNAPAIIGNLSDFSGLYTHFVGGISLSDLLFGSSTCLLNLDARVGTTAYYLDGPSSANFGYWEREDIDISLLCVLSGSVGYGIGGQATKDASGYHLEVVGSGDACGSLGPCPFCVQGCKTVTIKGVLKTSGIDYYLDY